MITIQFSSSDMTVRYCSKSGQLQLAHHGLEKVIVILKFWLANSFNQHCFSYILVHILLYHLVSGKQWSWKDTIWQPGPGVIWVVYVCCGGGTSVTTANEVMTHSTGCARNRNKSRNFHHSFPIQTRDYFKEK